MKCPKCGYHRQTKDNAYIPGNECPSCGILYNKHEKAVHPDEKKSAPSGPLRNPSPVSASSLRKARERVERRLRKKQGPKVRDLRHIQTLEMARRLTAEGVRQRQAEWEKRTSENAAMTNEREGERTPSESSTHLPVEPKPKKKVKQLTTTVAKALDKQQSGPKEPSETMPSSPSPVETASHDSSASSLMVEVEQTPDKQADTEASPVPNDPIPLFQSKAKTTMSKTNNPPSLKEMLKDFDPPNTEKGMDLKSFNPFRKIPANGVMQLLPVVAWLILGAGVIGTILSWTTIGDVQAAMDNSTPTGNKALPLGLLLGFAYLATGVLGFAFFWVSSLISRQLNDIRQLLLLQSAPEAAPEQVQAPDER